ncbi:BZIP domain-containing protein [Heracleum sosnowskyi]|uniref:BZIP domain-containing protein n=1 Tax=Heracleum sosnowskyi TaxID=360622 RepID=A0AAD8IWN8_9APIA|nr:BZIP domain-containing protein [Heracleum sosnowskyi]
MSDYGEEKQEEDEDDDDMLKKVELEEEEETSLPNDEEWNLSDSEFFNFFIHGGFDSSSSSSLPVDNQGIIDNIHPKQLPVSNPNGENDANTIAQDDPILKKRTRQERNRDAALRSREKKKLYVKELEMKSRYFEGECKRLGMLLNCVSAENHALRLSVQSSKAFDVSRTKQESAVLFLESLLLGSLLWFLGVMCLHNLPEPLQSTRKLPLRNMDNQNWGILAPRKIGSNISEVQVFQSLMRGKRCKASRTRMKLRFSFAQQALMLLLV